MTPFLCFIFDMGDTVVSPLKSGKIPKTPNSRSGTQLELLLWNSELPKKRFFRQADGLSRANGAAQ